MEGNHIKILFSFYSDVLEQHTVETMWAVIVDEEQGLYKLDSIPFYAPSIASDDIFFAEYDQGQEMLTYRETVEFSGNSNIQVVIMDNSDINTIRDIFSNLGCVSERLNDKYFAMEVPVNVNYKPIKDKLSELERTNVLSYAEPCLADGHREQMDS